MSTHVSGFQLVFSQFFASFCNDQDSHQQHKGTFDNFGQSNKCDHEGRSRQSLWTLYVISDHTISENLD